jgi:hypothetical protein
MTFFKHFYFVGGRNILRLIIGGGLVDTIIIKNLNAGCCRNLSVVRVKSLQLTNSH